MKEIDYYIESNTKLLKDRIEARNNTTNLEERKRLTILIKETDYYIKGRKDAKEYIKKELGDKNETI